MNRDSAVPGARNERSGKIVFLISLAALLAGAALVALPAFGSLEYLLVHVLVDDSFYYLLPAHNLAHGHGLTFDSVNTTNGFQPLWMLLLLPLAFVSANREVFLRLALVYQALIYLLALYLIVREAVRARESWLAIVTAVLWMALGLRHDMTVSLATNALESALYFFTLSAGFVLTLRASRGDSKGLLSLHAVVMGFMVLTRIDSFPFAALMSLFVAWHRVQRRGLKTTIYELVPGYLLAAALVVIYVVWSINAVGVPLPVSGLIKVYHARQHTLNQFGGMATLAFLRHALTVLSQSVTIIASLVFGVALPPGESRLLRLRLLISVSDPARGQILAGLLLLAFLVMAIVGIRSVSKRDLSWRALVAFLGLAAFVHLALHTLTLWPYALYNVWHYVGEIFFLLMLVAWIISSFLRIITRYSRAAAWSTLAAFVLVILFAQVEVIGQHLNVLPSPFPLVADSRTGLYRASRWTERHLLPDTRLGAFNAGIAGYFTSRRVTNLDGLINSPVVYQYLRNRIHIGGYIAEQGLEYLIDYAPQGGWPLTEVGGIHYLDLYDAQSASFVMDMRLLTAESLTSVAPIAWPVSIRTRAGEIEHWIGTAWDVSQSESLAWRVADGTGQVVAGPFAAAPTWLPEVPPPRRSNRTVFDYRPLPAAPRGATFTVEINTDRDTWDVASTVTLREGP